MKLHVIIIKYEHVLLAYSDINTIMKQLATGYSMVVATVYLSQGVAFVKSVISNIPPPPSPSTSAAMPLNASRISAPVV